jgi:integrase
MIGTRFQQGCLMRVKNKTTDDTWFLRFYEDQGGKRVYRKQRIGTVREFPHRRDAEKAVLSLRANINTPNTEARSPQTVNDLITHYSKHELNLDRKSFSTVDVNTVFINKHVTPKWGNSNLSEVRTVAVENWLDSLPLAPSSRSKIRNIMSAIFSHGIRHEWFTFNPISKVRCSAKRLREPDVLTPAEFQALVLELELREKVMVMLAGSTGLRRSEMFALKWSDVNFDTMEVAVTKSCVRGRFGKVKTAASGKPVPLHMVVLDLLRDWRGMTRYKQDSDFLFASERLNGDKPLAPDMVLKRVIRPALVRAGISKVIGWHSFRHSLATNLRTMGVDVKVAQELMLHANSRITMDLYTQAVSSDKRNASSMQVQMMTGQKAIIPSNPLTQIANVVSD